MVGLKICYGPLSYNLSLFHLWGMSNNEKREDQIIQIGYIARMSSMIENSQKGQVADENPSR